MSVALSSDNSSESIYLVKIEERKNFWKYDEGFVWSKWKGKSIYWEALHKVQMRELNKNQLQLRNDDVFVAQGQVFGVFIGIVDDLTMSNDHCIHLVKWYKTSLNKKTLSFLVFDCSICLIAERLKLLIKGSFLVFFCINRI